jgi:hypothetical protein
MVKQMSGVLDVIKSVLPFVGTALGGPLGGLAADFVGSKLGLSTSTVDTVKAVLGGMPPEKLVEIKQIELEFQLKMAGLGYDSIYKLEQLNASVLDAVNKTMQAEAASEHWPTYSWRPFCGFVFGTMFLGVYFILPLLKLPVPVVPTEAWMSMGAVLGVASWFRGKMQADPVIATNNKG